MEDVIHLLRHPPRRWSELNAASLFCTVFTFSVKYKRVYVYIFCFQGHRWLLFQEKKNVHVIYLNANLRQREHKATEEAQ